MPTNRPKPKFSGSLAEPIYEPVFSGGLLGLPEDEDRRRARIFDAWQGKLELLLDHYNIDRAAPDRWEMLSFWLAMDFVPGMRVERGRRPKPGRKRTWQAGLGTDLLLAVGHRMAETPSSIGEAIDHLRDTDPKWKGFTPENLAARLREARREDRRREASMAQLRLKAGAPPSLADLASIYAAANQQRMGGLFGLGQFAASNRPADQSGGNSEN